MRNESNLVGIGCFAQNATLRRVFRKSLESLNLGKYEDICASSERMVNEENLTRFFRSVIALGTEKPDHIDRAIETFPISAKVTGFYLSLNNQALHLAVFLLDDDFRRTKFIACLEKFTRLRKKRLH
jgi:hypothetical protein